MTLEELNEAVLKGPIKDIIRVDEARQCKMLSKIADDICSRDGARLVLVAGGSSAGKTTTAKRLATQIMVNDRAVVHLSTDDYFVGDEKNPRDENGELDYEHVECVDMKKLAEDVNALMRGEAVRERRFDFVRHEPSELESTISLRDRGFVIIEGIHALNPRLTEDIPDDAKYRIFVEPHPTLDVFAGIVPKSADVRFLRRMVRDNQFRKMSPATTVGIWPKVLAGEDRWINPFRGNADATFDSYLEYELAVLKPYVGGLLERARLELGPIPIVVNMIRLMSVVVATFPDAVPGDSIIRETIGGSQLEY